VRKMKPQIVDLADSNISNLGTELEKKCRLDAAQTELAWKDAGKAVNVLVWRIEQFKVVPWPLDRYGQFHTGDSYIVLNTWKKPDSPKLYHDIHFWLGRETSQDEAGTAAYKTAELDDYLGTIPVQHREVEGAESKLFQSYFKELLTLKGGVESGFNHVKPAEFRPRLLILTAPKKLPGKAAPALIIKEVEISFKSLNSGDVFVYDGGLQILQWNGEKSSGQEKVKGAEFCRRLDDSRKGLPKVTVYDEGREDSEFFTAIGGRGLVSPPIPDVVEAPFEKKLFRLSDASGTLSFSQVAKGNIPKSLLDSKDVFVLDTDKQLFVWVGKAASKSEKQTAMNTAVAYISNNNRPLDISVCVFREEESEGFFSFLH